MIVSGRSIWPLALVTLVCALSGRPLAAALPADSPAPTATATAPASAEVPRAPAKYTVPDEGRGVVDAFGDHFVVVAGKTIRWDRSTTYRLVAGRISVGMIAQWKGKRAGFTGDVLASQLTLSM